VGPITALGVGPVTIHDPADADRTPGTPFSAVPPVP
jgi:hypothetical protein